MNQQDNPSSNQTRLHLDAVICTVAGHIWQMVGEPDKSTPQAVAKASVRIKDSARVTETNEQGQFKFNNLQPGLYTLLVETQDGWQGERTIQVPPNYDVMLTAPSVPPTPATAVLAGEPAGPPAITVGITASLADSEAFKTSRKTKRT